ncbi:sugar transferase [Roseivivax sp. GX 12232]|uniref:sugar transferase n=1 Tax=Roseivivax sp. GX 12232 TaxID=2900547 RepID=UPI001E318C4D|nr:sugar transferase [Roseivivax sp. GX 12232]
MTDKSLRVGERRAYTLKRVFDLFVALVALTLAGPILLVSILLVWLQDRYSPFYLARRIARGGGNFTMIKVRSMIVRAESTGVNSTGTHDTRVTKIGRFIRKFKIDELSQFINVLIGDMSAVGPRPNTWAWGVELYTKTEMTILSVRPGITDLSSIVFSDEGDILDGAKNPDLLYNQIIRPWKNRLALWYIANMTLAMDIRICWLTLLAIFDKPSAIAGVVALLERGEADPDLIAVCRRDDDLPAVPPPGADEVETGERYFGV